MPLHSLSCINGGRKSKGDNGDSTNEEYNWTKSISEHIAAVNQLVSMHIRENPYPCYYAEKEHYPNMYASSCSFTQLVTKIFLSEFTREYPLSPIK